MKKLLSLICVCSMVAGFGSCGSSDANSESKAEIKSESSVAESEVSDDENSEAEDSEQEISEVEASEAEDSEEISDDEAEEEISGDEIAENADNQPSVSEMIEESNSLASQLRNAVNSALIDIDMNGGDVTALNGYQTYVPDDESGIDEQLMDSVKHYFEVNEEFSVYIENGVCTCAAVKCGEYYGAYPAVFSDENDYDESLDVNGVLEFAIAKNDEEQ